MDYQKQNPRFYSFYYNIPIIVIERTNLLSIKSLNFKFSNYQKQSPGSVQYKVCSEKVSRIDCKKSVPQFLLSLNYRLKAY